MSFTHLIRPLTNDDYPAIADLINSYEQDGVTAEILRGRDSRWEADAPRIDLISEDLSGNIVGYAKGARRNGDPAGKFMISIWVRQESTGSEIGLELRTRVEAFASGKGATFFTATVEETSYRGIEFAKRSGYVQVQHLFMSVLDLATFDPAPFVVQTAALQESGYKFLTLSGVGDTDFNRRRVHALDSRSDEDTPGIENWGIRSFEQYSKDELESFGFTVAGVTLAEFNGEWVAMNSIRPSTKEGIMHTDYTGVLREHRGRGLGAAVKAAGVQFAIRSGAHYVETHNDERNQPMLAINRRFGFIAKPGFYVYRKELGTKS